jgi:hypothetical protein
MIHAFLITIAVIAAIYAWPFILLGLCVCFKILTSKWFWLGILGLTLFILSCCFLGPITFLVLAIVYGMWQLIELNKRLANGRENIRRAYRSGELVLHNRTNRLSAIDKIELCNGTNTSQVAPIPQPTSDTIDWSKLQRQPEQRPREFIGFN